MKRVNANDAVTMRMLAQHYYKGENGFPQDQTMAMDLYARSADLGCGLAHYDMI
jgi:TPR repeat protein